MKLTGRDNAGCLKIRLPIERRQTDFDSSVESSLIKSKSSSTPDITEPEGSRKHFGDLLVGFSECKKFKFAGQGREKAS